MATPTTTNEAREPRLVTGSSSATLAFSASTSAIVIPGLPAVLAYVTVEPPHYHVAAEHDDPIALGTDGLVLALLFVSWKLVACRLLPLVGERTRARATGLRSPTTGPASSLEPTPLPPVTH